MSKSARLRAAEVRTISLLVGECRDLGDDSIAWRQHLLAGVARLAGAGFCVLGDSGMRNCRHATIWGRGIWGPIMGSTGPAGCGR